MEDLKILLVCFLFVLNAIVILPVGTYSVKSINEMIKNNGNIRIIDVLAATATLVLGGAIFPGILEMINEREVFLDRISFCALAIINLLVHFFQYYSKNMKKKKMKEIRAKKFKKIWNYGGYLLSVIIVVCAFIPLNRKNASLIMGIFIGIIWAVHKTGGALYHIYSSEKLNSIREKNANQYRLIQMDESTSQKYCQFKYTELVKNIKERLGIVGAIFVFPLMLGYGFFEGLHLLVCVLGIIVVAIVVAFCIVEDQVKQCRLLKNVTCGICEYIGIHCEVEKLIKLLTVDNKEVFFAPTFEELLEDIVLVYIPEVEVVYAEKKEKIMTLFPMLQETIQSEESDISESVKTFNEVDESCSIEKDGWENTGSFYKMNMEETNCYKAYRSKQDQRSNLLILGVAVCALIGLGVFLLFSTGGLNKTIIVLLLAGTILLIGAFLLLSRIRMNKLKDATDTPYEYAFDRVILNEKRELTRDNGEIVRYEIKSGRGNTFATDEEIVVIYIPQGNLVYVEKKETWEQLYPSVKND